MPKNIIAREKSSATVSHHWRMSLAPRTQDEQVLSIFPILSEQPTTYLCGRGEAQALPSAVPELPHWALR